MKDQESRSAAPSERPSFGPAWDAAIQAGIDVHLLLENLELSPTERLEQLQRMTELYEALRPKGVTDATHS